MATVDNSPVTLEALAADTFGELSEAELSLCRQASLGESAECDTNREIRAVLIRWLCVNARATSRVDPRGVSISGGRIVGELDLSFVSVGFPLRFQGSSFSERINLTQARIPSLVFHGCQTRSVEADGAKVSGDLLFCDGFTAEGEVRLRGAKIGGDLNCYRARFNNPNDRALDADGINVGGSALLNQGFVAQGEVRLISAEVGGDLDCSGAHFRGPIPALGGQPGPAFSASGIKVKGSVLLKDDFVADGEVALPDADIALTLDCSGGHLENRGSVALGLDRARIGGSTFLIDGFSVRGQVRLVAARIGESLYLQGSDLCEAELDAKRVTVKSVLDYTKMSEHGFQSRKDANTRVDLRNAAVGWLHQELESWPQQGNLFLDGFVYDRISEPSLVDATQRLRWLRLCKPFHPQPYLQLASALREHGADETARRILIGMEDERRALIGKEHDRRVRGGLSRLMHGRFSQLRRFWLLVLKATIGYGYRPERALWWILGFVFFGFVAFGASYSAGTLVPSDKDAYKQFNESGKPPGGYEPFCAAAYSVDTFVPLIDLGQKSYWLPGVASHHGAGDSSSSWIGRLFCDATLTESLSAKNFSRSWIVLPSFIRFYRWAHIILGWFFTSMFVAGVTGLVRRG